MHEIIEMVLSYLRSMWRYRWYALGLAWLICLGGWLHVSKMPDQYRASAQVYVDTQSMLRPLLRGLAVDTNPRSQINMMTRTLLSRDNLEKIARMTDLDLRASDRNAMEEVLLNLRTKIRLSTGRRDNTYTIAVNDQDPRLARNLVQAAMTIFMEDAIGGSRLDTDTAQRFLDRQIAEYEARLVAAERRVTEFKRDNMGLMPGQGGGYYNRMQSVASELERARLALRQAENRRDVLRQQIEDEELAGELAQFGMGFSLPQQTSTFSSPLDGRIQNLEQRLDELLIRYTEQHPDVIITRQTIADLQRQREEGFAQWQASMAGRGQASSEGNPYSQQLKIILGQEEANIASLQVRVEEYERRLEQLRQLVHTVPDVEAQLADLNRDYNVTRRNYEQLLARREQAHISEQVGQTDQGVRFRVIEPPRVPSAPSGPNRPLLMSGVLVLGLGAGAGLAFLLVLLRPTFDSRRGLMEATNIPVLGSVSMVLSPATVRRERMELLAYCSLGACLLTVYAGWVVVQATGINIPIL